MISVLLVAGVAGVVARELRREVGALRVRRRLCPPGSTAPGPLVPRRVRSALHAAGVTDEERAVRTWLAALVVTGVLAAVAAGGRILFALTLIGPPVALQLGRDRLARRRARQLPDALDAVAAGLRGGHGLVTALGGAAAIGPPLGDELEAIHHGVEAGRPLAEAIDRWQASAVDPHTALAAAALAVAATVGGPGARAVDGAAASLRDRLAADDEAAALATQARASAMVLTVAPIGFAVLLTTLDPTAARFLLGTPVGWLCITVGLGLDGLGAWWMARLVRRAR